MAATSKTDNPKARSTQQIQIKFKTVQEKYAIPDTTMSVPGNVGSDGLNNLLKDLLLKEGSVSPVNICNLQFDFILLDELVRGSLNDVLAARAEDSVVSLETVLEVLYIAKQRPPEPKKNVNHDDWVAGVAGKYQKRH